MNQSTIDRISLEQALIDFEVANARVIDLTERLTNMSRELNEARQAQNTLAELQQSRAFKIVRLLGRVRRAIT